MASGPLDIPLSDLLARAARGDEPAWSTIVHAYTPRVFGLVVRQCGDRDLAEEITQQTFVKLVVQLGDEQGYQEQGRFEAWLFRIAINALRDELRRRQRHARPMDMSDADTDDDTNAAWRASAARVSDAPEPLDNLSRQEQIEQLRQAMASLNDADQQILHLRHTAGLSFPQIAEALQQPLGTVLARAHRAVAKLRKILQDQLTPDT